MAIIRSGDLDRLITFQSRDRPPLAPGAIPDPMRAGKAGWIDFASAVPAQVQDMLPSRGERLAEGLVITLRPARIRIRYRPDITSAMSIIYGARVMEIMAEPIELGRREGLELMAQDYSTAGRPA